MLGGRADGEWRATSVETREVNGEGMRLRDTPNHSTKGNAVSILSMSYSNRVGGKDSPGARASTVLVLRHAFVEVLLKACEDPADLFWPA